MLRSFPYILASAIAAALFITAAQEADASCGSANCFLVTGTQEGIAIPGQIILDLSYRWVPMDDPQRGSKDISEAFTPGIDTETGEIEPDHHREIRTNNELVQLDIGIGVTERLSLALTLPVFNLRTHEHDVIHEGEPDEFSGEDGTSGFGDIRLTGKYALWISTKHLFVGGLGVKAPSGEYKLKNHDGEINEPTIQPGTGSWDGLVSAYYAYEVLPHRLNLFLSGSFQIATENSLDYKMGNTLILNTGASVLFTNLIQEKPLTASLQINSRQAPHDEFQGQEVPSTGGRWVYITPGIRVQATPSTSLYTHVQIPLYQYVNEENIVPRYGLIMGISHAF
jgi:hypothetical protein